MIVKLLFMFKRLAVYVQVAISNISRSNPVYVIGDSWANLTVFNFSGEIDLIDWLRKICPVPIIDAAIPGYTLKGEARHRLYRTVVRRSTHTPIKIFLSLGGNDILDHSGSYLIANYDMIVSNALSNLRRLIADILGSRPGGIQIVIHGYDYVEAKTRTLGWKGSLSSRFHGTGLNDSQIDLFMRKVIDLYNSGLNATALLYHGHVHYADLRGTLLSSERWLEDIHPGPDGYRKLAERLVRKAPPEFFGVRS